MGTNSKTSKHIRKGEVPKVRERTGNFRENQQLCEMYSLRRAPSSAEGWKGRDQGRIELSSQASQALMPEVGDLVVATVTRVEDYGAYVKLDEFSGIEGLVHISEISTTWVRNIREHARQGQKLVLKVLRVSSQRNQIDLSLRRVTGREKSEKMLEWKKERKAEAILTSAADKLKKSAEDAEDIKKVLLDKFGGL